MMENVKRMKRLFCATLIIVMVFMFSACGSKSIQESNSYESSKNVSTINENSKSNTNPKEETNPSSEATETATEQLAKHTQKPSKVITETTNTSTEEPSSKTQNELNNSNEEKEYVEKINEAAKGLSGDIDWGVHCFGDDYKYISDSNSVSSASVIKLFIMEYAFDQEKNGKLSMSDTIEGSTVTDLLERMITKSENTATNVFIDAFGMPALNQFIAENGYTDTRVERRMLDTEAMKQGKDNFTSVKDVMSFLEKVYENKDTYPYSEMLNIMKRQTRVNKIPSKIPSSVVIANKTGELSNVENDVGIVFIENYDVAMVFLCSSLSNCPAAREFIGDSAYLIYQYYS